MKLKKYISGLLFLFTLFLLGNISVYAGDLELLNLDYHVTLNADGTANVTESWDIAIEDTNTLFKTFELDSSKYSGITDVSLIETTNGTRTNFSRIFTEKYHVDNHCFYALINSKKQFEIAWGVHEENNNTRRKFEMTYTILDAVKNYTDISEFYWQFISTSSAIPVKKVTGSITLPSPILVEEDFRIWAHGPLNGTITKTSNSTAYFEVEDLPSNTMLETRVVTPTYVFANNANVSSSHKLPNILEQEQTWAEEANRKREAIAKRKNGIIAFFILTNIIGIIPSILLLKKIKEYQKQLQKAPNFKATSPSKYYRDIPNEKASPAQAAFVYYFKTSSLSYHIPEVISATLLDLCMKKYLTFEMLENKKKEIKITLLPNREDSLLLKDERVIYQMLEKVSPNREFTMKEFEKYAKSHSSSFLKQYELIAPYAKSEVEAQGNYDTTLIKQYENWALKEIGFIFLTIVSLAMIVNIIPSILCCIYCSKIAKRYHTLTQKGVEEKEAWIGLKHYMEDFSMMDQKEVPELPLWEKYLVYATAFGISDKVLEQLKVVYPQLTDEQYMTSHGYYYLYWMSYGNFSNNFIHRMNHSITTTYNSINYSSGSGSGGGFSSGGGFGGGGGRNGRKIMLAISSTLSYNRIN